MVGKGSLLQTFSGRFGPSYARLAVLTRTFPLYEIGNRERTTINFKPAPRPVRNYLRSQGRFHYLTDEQIEVIQKRVDKDWERLLKRASW